VPMTVGGSTSIAPRSIQPPAASRMTPALGDTDVLDVVDEGSVSRTS
jgi:hypothetical protein